MTWAISLWVLKYAHSGSLSKQALRLLLAEPRQFYTHLYPSKQTMILALSWFAITGVEYLVFFDEWNNEDVFQNNTAPHKLLIMWFQTVSVRTAGYNNVNIGSFGAGHLALYVFTMYISSYPVSVSMRASSAGTNKTSYSKQARKLLTREILWLYLAALIIAFIAEWNGKELLK